MLVIETAKVRCLISIVKRSRTDTMAVKEGASSETLEEEGFLLSMDVECLGGIITKLLEEDVQTWYS